MNGTYAPKWHPFDATQGSGAGFFAGQREPKGKKRVERIYQWNEGYGKDETATQGQTRPFLMA
jgi:hypothetical protein